MYQNGQGVTQDYAKAFQCYSQSASLHDPNAFDRLGLLYYRGMGVSRDMVQAFQFFTQGAGLGDSWAELNLGQMYEGGHVRPDHTIAPSGPGNAKPVLTPDFGTALRLYTQSAAQGNRVAAYKAGVMYETGSGAPQNYELAFSYYKKSVSKQYLPAYIAIGKLHELGLGTSVNLLHAYVAYSVAAQLGDAEATDRLRTVTRRLTPDQLSRARALLERYLVSFQTGIAE
jgi:TPR repeat protein